MSRRRLRLRQANDLTLTGCGWNLTLTFTAWREKRRAGSEAVEVTVQLTRPNVKCLLNAVSKMHMEDRARLKREADRIIEEVFTLRNEGNG